MPQRNYRDRIQNKLIIYASIIVVSFEKINAIILFDTKYRRDDRRIAVEKFVIKNNNIILT